MMFKELYLIGIKERGVRIPSFTENDARFLWNGCEASETKNMEGSFPAEKPRKPIRYTSWHKFLRPAHVTGHEAFESCNIY